MRRLPIVFCCCLTLVMIIGCAGGSGEKSKPRFESSQTFMTQAEVLTVDHEERTLTVRRTDGKEITTTVAPEVQNFKDVKQGDVLELSIFESIILEVVKTDDLTSSGQFTASEGYIDDAPTIGGEEHIVVRAKIIAIDMATRSLTLMTEDGNTTEFDAGPDVKNLENLELGDVVQAKITIAVTISARKVQNSNN